MLVHESRILQVTIFGTLQSNLNSLDFSLLLPDVMTIADEVDAQFDTVDGKLHECHAKTTPQRNCGYHRIEMQSPSSVRSGR
jgi:hypothetical protein